MGFFCLQNEVVQTVPVTKGAIEQAINDALRLGRRLFFDSEEMHDLPPVYLIELGSGIVQSISALEHEILNRDCASIQIVRSHGKNPGFDGWLDAANVEVDKRFIHDLILVNDAE